MYELYLFTKCSNGGKSNALIKRKKAYACALCVSKCVSVRVMKEKDREKDREKKRKCERKKNEERQI